MKDIQSFINKVENQLKNKEFVGYNPYDLMDSPYFQSCTNKKLLMYSTQIYRLLPINFRPILKTNKLYSPKANGLLLSAMAMNVNFDLSKLLIIN